MKLIIASNNNKKINELKSILSVYFDDMFSLKEADILHETIEDKLTFEENALKKAREIMQLSGCAALADDSGLEVDALNGAPGVLSARFAGEHGNDEKNNLLLLEKLKNIPIERRTARFKSVIALVFPDGREAIAEGSVEGIIIDTPQGENGFGYDPIFFIPELGQTFAQLPSAIKNNISHRAKAAKALVEKLKGIKIV